MIPDPLHPAIVHFPIVLAILLPISALVALWAIRRGARPLYTWAIPVVLAIALAGSSWLAVETGEQQEERVERVVPEQAIERHADAAERFLVLSAVLAAVLAAGLLRGTVGTAARWVGTAGALALVAAAIQVGARGGDLVYRHNAGAAYTTGAAPGVGPAEAGLRGERDED